MAQDQKKKESLFSEKVTVRGKWVAVMNSLRNDRGIILTPFYTRCVKKNEIHEFIACDKSAIPDKPIDHIAYLGFGEVMQGGVIEIGDRLYLKDHPIGTILGFDETHFPNHYNVIIKVDILLTGFALKIKPTDNFSIKNK